MTIEKGVLPPVVELLLAETRVDYGSSVELYEHVRNSGLLRELKSQAEYTLDEWKYADESPVHRGALKFCPAASLDPFGPWGKCSTPRCRVAIAERFARTVGIYADEVIVPDPATALVYRAEENAERRFEELQTVLAALRTLEPLMRAGVIRFGRPARRYCDECQLSVEKFLDTTIAQVEDVLKEGLTYQLTPLPNGDYVVGFKYAGADGVHSRTITESAGAQLRTTEAFVSPTEQESIVLSPYLSEAARMLLATAFTARLIADGTGGLLATGDAATAHLFEGARGSVWSNARFAELQKVQAIDLPFVRELTIDEIVVLRQEAANALPRFRSVIERSILRSDAEADVRDVVAELRGQAADVKAELAALERGRRWRAGLMAGSVGLSMVLFAASPPLGAAALAGALAAMAGMHPHSAKDEIEAAKLESNAGYVLVRAEGLLRHAQE